MTVPSWSERLRHILMAQWGIDHVFIVGRVGQFHMFHRAGDGMYCLDPLEARYVRRAVATEKK